MSIQLPFNAINPLAISQVHALELMPHRTNIHQRCLPLRKLPEIRRDGELEAKEVGCELRRTAPLSAGEWARQVISQIAALVAERVLQDTPAHIPKRLLEILDVLLVRGWNLADLIFHDVGRLVLAHCLERGLLHLSLELWWYPKEVYC